MRDYSSEKEQKKIDAVNSTIITLVFAYTITIAINVLTAFLLNRYIILKSINVATLASRFIPKHQFQVSPKPKEQIISFILLALLLPTSFCAIKFANMVVRKIKKINFLHLSESVVLSFSLFIFICCYQSYYIQSFTELAQNSSNLCIGLLTTSVFIWYGLQHINLRNTLIKYLCQLIILVIVMSVLILVISVNRVFGLPMIEKNNHWVINFGAVFYSVSQVYAGKTLLFNLPAQYGLYAEILNPIFKIIGLSVFKFSLVMAVLQSISLFSIFIVIWRYLNSKFLFLFCALTLCLDVGFIWLFITYNVSEPYLQYYPIRFFFPATTLLLFIFFIERTNFKWVIGLSVFFAIGFIWNLESGIAPYGSLFVYLLSYVFFPTQNITTRKASYFVIVSVISFVLTVLSFFIYLILKARHIIHFNWLLKYQTIFYKTGFAMLPIPIALDPWLIVCGIYIFGIIVSLNEWINSRRDQIFELVFVLSILGLGLFGYFEGRSHHIVLILVSWPAILIIFLLVDKLLFLQKNNNIPSLIMIITYPFILFGFFSSIVLLNAIPKMVTASKNNLSKLLSDNQTEVIANLNFIKNNLNGEKNVLILAPNQSVYYGELDLASSIDGPGIIETLLNSDLRHFESKVIINKPIIFYQGDSDPLHMQDFSEILKCYKIKTSNLHQMRLLVKKD